MNKTASKSKTKETAYKKLFLADGQVSFDCNFSFSYK